MNTACHRCGGPMFPKYDVSLTSFDSCALCGYEDYGEPDYELPEHARYRKASTEVWRRRKANRRFGERLPVAGQKQSVNRKQ